MTIVCITDQLAGWTVEVDRETDATYEEDVIIYGLPSICIYPKPAWRPALALVIPGRDQGAWF